MHILKGPAAARIAPFVVFFLILALNEPLSSLVEGMGMDARWLYACRMGLVALMLAWFWRSYSELAWPVAMPLQTWLASLLAGVAVFALWIMPYPEWATFGSGAGFDPARADGGIDPLLAAVRIAGAALVVPLMEELFWRSYIMRWLDRSDFLAADPNRVSLRAFIITAAFFAVGHHLWLAGLLAGIAYGWLYKVSRNLWAPVLAHAVTNATLGFWVLQTDSWEYW